MTEILETVHQGIPTVLASRPGGTMLAGLVFRVGRADETLATTGITHLVEHLALHEHGVTDLHYNGQTDDTFTQFIVQGTEAEIVDYLNGVCRSLRELPMARLETEKQILRTESDTRGGSNLTAMSIYRYGAQGYGLVAYDEIGLTNVTPDSAASWVERWFTRQNAVLWITADQVPDGLDLRLPDGVRRPMPVVTSALETTPAWMRGNGNATVLDAVIPRSTAGSVFATVLSKRMFRELRQESGLCYTADASYYPRDADKALIRAYADADPAKREAVVGGFIDVLAGLRFGTVEQSELDAARTRALRYLEEPEERSRRLPGYAANLLSGHPNLTAAELVRELEQISAEDLREIAEEVWASALLQLPVGDLDWAGVTAAPAHSTSTVSGQTFASLSGDGTAIVIGHDGVSVTYPGGQSTVLFRDTVAMASWPDGARQLTGRDGFHVSIEPTLHPVTPAALAQIDTSVPGPLHIRMPARDPERIPVPRVESSPTRQGSGSPAGRPTMGRAVRLLRQTAAWVLSIIALILVVSGVTMIVDPAPDQKTPVGTGIFSFALAGIFAGCAWGALRGTRR